MRQRCSGCKGYRVIWMRRGDGYSVYRMCPDCQGVGYIEGPVNEEE